MVFILLFIFITHFGTKLYHYNASRNIIYLIIVILNHCAAWLDRKIINKLVIYSYTYV